MVPSPLARFLAIRISFRQPVHERLSGDHNLLSDVDGRDLIAVNELVHLRLADPDQLGGFPDGLCHFRARR